MWDSNVNNDISPTRNDMISLQKASLSTCLLPGLTNEIVQNDIWLRRMIYRARAAWYIAPSSQYDIISVPFIRRRRISSHEVRYHTESISPVPPRNGYHWKKHCFRSAFFMARPEGFKPSANGIGIRYSIHWAKGGCYIIISQSNYKIK